MYFFYAQNVSVLKKKVNELIALLDGPAEVYRSPGRMYGQVRRLRWAAFDRSVRVNAKAGHAKQEAAIILEDGCAGTLDRVRAVFVSRVRPNGHLRPMIGGTCDPSFGRMEFPIEYPTIDPNNPVPADWSIFPVDIKTVMQIMATRTISALGGLVMFTRCLNLRRTAAGILSLNGSPFPYLKMPPKSHKSLTNLRCQKCKPQ